MPDRLKDKVAIVTGSGTREGDGIGVGRAIATLMAREGANVLVVDRDEANALVTAKALSDEGLACDVTVADVSNVSDCEQMVQTAIDKFGQLTTLVNAVGIGGGGNVTEIEEDFWQHVLDVNLKSMVFASKAAVPRMVEGGGGSITHISSIDGIRAGFSENVAYAASKGGAIGITPSMAVHHARKGVRVNCIAPGHLYTPMVSSYISLETREMRRKAGPLGVEGTAWDVAWAAIFLASDEARWVNGVVLPVDAGVLSATPLAMYPYLRDEE
ncbi:MAG: SDR family oxidoreductase [Candidatus Latescibacterota bacterium]|nr:SDR family oxidoreductase [Candidatus Latescibacterota bacterium]